MRPANETAAGPYLGSLKRSTLASAIAVAAALGIVISHTPAVAFVIIALTVCIFLSPFTETLAVICLWTLPYMVVNLPTGSFTLKLCDGMAYLFAGATFANAILRRQKILLPPASGQFIVFLAALAISTAWEPVVALPYMGVILPQDRNSPDYRSASMMIWEIVSWAVVVAYYNVVGSKPGMLRKCVCAHIRSAGLASIISLIFYCIAISGISIHSFSNTGARSLAPESNTGFFRLAGVAYEPLFLGFYFGITIPTTFAVMRFKPNWLPRWQIVGSLVLQSIAMFATFSAGGWASLFVSLTLFLYWTRDRNRKRTTAEKARTAAAVVVVLAVLTGLLISAKPVMDKVSGTIGKITEGGDAVRKGEWAVGYGLIGDYPWLGCGPGLANYYFPRYHPKLVSQTLQPGISEVNNVYLGTLADTGIVGFVAFCWCGLSAFAAMMKGLKTYGARNAPILASLIAALIGCAVQYMSMGPTTLILIYFVGISGLAMAATRPLAPAAGATTRTEE